MFPAPIRAMMFDQGGVPTIACVNLATGTDAANYGMPFGQLVRALQVFNDTYFSPVWGTPCRIIESPHRASAASQLMTPTVFAVGPNDWTIVFMDDPDQADAFGYHDLAKNGQPVSKVFVKVSLQANEKVSVTACHELCEMLIDPGCQLWADDGKGKFWAYEMCDAVEESTFMVDGVEMSDFVHPAYFESFRKKGTSKFDHLALLKAPFTLLKGGYSIIRQGNRTSQVFGSKAKEKRFAKEDRRLHRSEYRLGRARR
jgi:hypothetical protein